MTAEDNTVSFSTRESNGKILQRVRAGMWKRRGDAKTILPTQKNDADKSKFINALLRRAAKRSGHATGATAGDR